MCSLKMEELDYSFQSSTIRRMELTLLQSLGWRLGCITTYSFVELLLSNFDSLESHLHNELTTLVTKLLLGAVLGTFSFFLFRFAHLKTIFFYQKHDKTVIKNFDLL